MLKWYWHYNLYLSHVNYECYFVPNHFVIVYLFYFFPLKLILCFAQIVVKCSALLHPVRKTKLQEYDDLSLLSCPDLNELIWKHIYTCLIGSLSEKKA